MIITVTWRFWVNLIVALLIVVSISASAIMQLRMDDGTQVYVWTADEMGALSQMVGQLHRERDAAVLDAKKSRECI